MRGKGVTGESPADFSSIQQDWREKTPFCFWTLPSNSEHFQLKISQKISQFGQNIKLQENEQNVPMRGKGVTGESTADFSSIQQDWREKTPFCFWTLPSNSEHFQLKISQKISQFGQNIKLHENAPNVPMRGKGVTGESPADFSFIQQD